MRPRLMMPPMSAQPYKYQHYHAHRCPYPPQDQSVLAYARDALVKLIADEPPLVWRRERAEQAQAAAAALLSPEARAAETAAADALAKAELAAEASLVAVASREVDWECDCGWSLGWLLVEWMDSSES